MPKVFVIGGCNGAGKTTASRTILPEILDCREFVNADEIASALSPKHPEAVAFRAGRIMLERIRRLAETEIDFAFETTLATKSYVPMLEKFRTNGDAIILIDFSLESVELAIQRVADRVGRGGHSIPEDVIRRRYQRGIENFHTIFTKVADSWVLYDNSLTFSKLVARKTLGLDIEVFDADIWNRIRK
jgi:predicted ABC-type ATPase